jgi:hypothetical protein
LNKAVSRTAADLASAEALDEMRLARLGIGANRGRNNSPESNSKYVKDVAEVLDHDQLEKSAAVLEAGFNEEGNELGEGITTGVVSTNTDQDVAKQLSVQRAIADPNSDPNAVATSYIECTQQLAAVASGNTYSQLLKEGQRNAAMGSAAATLGLSRGNMISDSYGNCFVDPSTLTSEQTRSMVEQGRPEMFADVSARDGETSVDHGNRVCAELIATGSMYVTEGDEKLMFVNPLAGQSSEEQEQVITALLNPTAQGSKEAVDTYRVKLSETPTGDVLRRAVVQLTGHTQSAYEEVRREAVVAVQGEVRGTYDHAHADAVQLRELTQDLSAIVGRISAPSSAEDKMQASKAYDELLPLLAAAAKSAANNTATVTSLTTSLDHCLDRKADDRDFDLEGQGIAAAAEAAYLLAADSPNPSEALVNMRGLVTRLGAANADAELQLRKSIAAANETVSFITSSPKKGQLPRGRRIAQDSTLSDDSTFPPGW